MKFNSQLDRQRRQQSALDWIVYQGKWSRPEVGGWFARGWNQAPIEGPYGDVLRRAVESAYEAGKGRDILDAQGNRLGEGYPLRWSALISTLDPGWNLTQILAGKDSPGRLGVLYREPIRVSLDSDAWADLRAKVGLDSALVTKQSYSIALGSAGVGVCLNRNHLPGLRVYAPHEVTFIPAPWNDATAIAAIYHDTERGQVVVSDLRSETFGAWTSVDDWASGRQPIWSLQGAQYPFRYAGAALLHIIPCRMTSTSGLQPGAEALRQLTIDFTLEMGWARLVQRVGSFDRAIVVSEGQEPPSGLERLSLDPLAVGAVWGTQKPSVETIPNSSESARAYYDRVVAGLQTRLSQLEGDVRVREGSTGVQSGRAIELERQGLTDYARQQMSIQRPTDTAIVQLLVGAYNWSIRTNIIRAPAITEGDITIEYPLSWSAAERTAIATELEQTDPVGAYIIRSGGQPDDPATRRAAFEHLQQCTAERVALVSQGYSVSADALYQSGGAPPVQTLEDATPEETDDVYDVPVSVSAEAVRGLQLYARFNRPGTPAQDRRGSPNARRVGALLRAGRVEYDTLVEIQALGGDALAARGMPGWSNAANPSTEWIDYLCYGGDAGQEWIADEFEGPEEDDSEAPAVAMAGAPAKYSHINFKPPESVASNARRGLDLRDKFGRGGTAIGIARGRDLANRKTISPSTARRMKAYFDRHQSDKRPGWSDPSKPSNGYIAWMLWGGDAGYAWARKLVKQMEAADE